MLAKIKLLRKFAIILPLCGLGGGLAAPEAVAQTAQAGKAAAEKPAAAVKKPRAAQDAVTVTAAWARAMLPGAKVGAGYFDIKNGSGQAVRLASVQSAAAQKVEIHSMTMDGAVMKMRQLTEGVEIAPHSGLSFKPGAYHLMFINPKTPFKSGERFNARFVFADGKTMDVPFSVRAAGAHSSGHAMHSAKSGAKPAAR